MAQGVPLARPGAMEMVIMISVVKAVTIFPPDLTKLPARYLGGTYQPRIPHGTPGDDREMLARGPRATSAKPRGWETVPQTCLARAERGDVAWHW
jgi:hypothetical protein